MVSTVRLSIPRNEDWSRYLMRFRSKCKYFKCFIPLRAFAPIFWIRFHDKFYRHNFGERIKTMSEIDLIGLPVNSKCSAASEKSSVEMHWMCAVCTRFCRFRNVLNISCGMWSISHRNLVDHGNQKFTETISVASVSLQMSICAECRWRLKSAKRERIHNARLFTPHSCCIYSIATMRSQMQNNQPTETD